MEFEVQFFIFLVIILIILFLIFYRVFLAIPKLFGKRVNTIKKYIEEEEKDKNERKS